MNLKTIVSSVSLVALFFTGCASIVDGGDKSVRINSTPPGAKVSIIDKSGKTVCTQTTPAIVSLRRNRGFFVPEDYKLAFELNGYYPAEAHVKSVVNGWYFGNVLFGGLIGIVIVDPATGANFTLSPRDINWNLVAVDTTLTQEQIAEAQVKANPPTTFKPAASESKRY